MTQQSKHIEVEFKRYKLATHTPLCNFIILLAIHVTTLCALANTAVVTNQPPAHAGWEASRDVALPARDANCRVFKAEFSFTATASNNVQIAFGKDLNADGKLPAEETAATVGWDRGAWFVRSGDLRTVFTNTPPGNTAATARTLKMAVRLDAGGTPTSLSFSDQDGSAVMFDGLAGIPAWISPEEWDTAALTARGWDVRDEAAQFSFVLDGTRILLR